MKVICLQENLKKNLLIVERISGKNINLPIISNCLIEAKEDSLKLSSTDLELACEINIPAKVEKEGRITIPVKTISELISNLPPQKIELESAQNNINIKGVGIKSVIHGENPEDFPAIPKIEKKKEEVVTLDYNEFKDGLIRVSNTISPNNIRPELSGVYVHISTSGIEIAATDSFRLAEKKISQGIKTNTSFIIPLKTTQEIVRIFENEEKLSFVANKNQVMFFSDTITLVSRLIEGEYPNYGQLIPQRYESQFSVEKEKIVPLIKATSLFSGRGNEIALALSKNALRVTASNTQKGEGEMETPIKLEGSEIEVVVNYRYLLDGIGNIPTKNVLIGLNGKTAPVVLRPQGDSLYTYLLMPIRS